MQTPFGLFFGCILSQKGKQQRSSAQETNFKLEKIDFDKVNITTIALKFPTVATKLICQMISVYPSRISILLV